MDLASLLDKFASGLDAQRQANGLTSAYDVWAGPQAGQAQQPVPPPQGGILSHLLGIPDAQPPQAPPGAPMQLTGAVPSNPAPAPGGGFLDRLLPPPSGAPAAPSATGTSITAKQVGALPPGSPVPGSSSAPTMGVPPVAPLAYAPMPTGSSPDFAAPQPMARQQPQGYAAAPAGPTPTFVTGQGTPSGILSAPGLSGLFAAQEQARGLPSGYLSRTAQIESRGDPNATNKSGAAGLVQFVPSTAAQYGLSDPTNPIASTVAAAKLAADNATSLRNALGRDPTAGELYLAHQQGAGGAAQLLANPDARAGDVVGDAAVRANGGDPNMTAGQFAAKWTSRFSGNGQTPNGLLAGGGAVPPLRGAPASQPAMMLGAGMGGQIPQATGFAGQAVPADAQGSAPSQDGPRSSLSYTDSSGVASTPAQQAIAAAAPAGDPLVTVPGYSGQWNKARIAAAPDGADVPDDGELAKAQGAVQGSPAATAAASPPVPAAAAAPLNGQVMPPTVPVPSNQNSIAAIRMLVSNPDTVSLGAELWKSMLTRTPPAFQHIEMPDGRVFSFNPANSQLSLIAQGVPNTDAIKNYTFAKSQGYGGSFTDYQDSQQKADKAQLADVPLANGQMQKVWITPGQDPSKGTPVGAPYTKRPDTAISIDTKGEGAEAQEAGKLAATRRGDMLAAADAAPDKIARLNLLGAVLDRTQTGPLAGAQGQVVNIANSLGISPDAISALGLSPNQAVDNQIAQKLANELVMGSIGAKNGGFPASNFSVAERQFIEKTFPNIAAQPGANQAVNDVLVAREQRNIEKGDAWSSYKQQQKAAGQPVSYEDFEGRWQQQHAGDNIFAPIQQKFIAGGYGPVGAAPPQTNPTNQASPQAPPAAPPPGAPANARRGTDGSFYVPDPTRRGKYLRVDP